jgi:hypothetical protein
VVWEGSSRDHWLPPIPIVSVSRYPIPAVRSIAVMDASVSA